MEFGPEIKVDGIRPEWLGEDDKFLVVCGEGEWSRPYTACEVTRFSWQYSVTAIRLPANHPHYSTPTPDERAVAPELVARLVELARSVATSPACTILQTVEAQNILAALEPVDRVEAEAELIYEGWSSNPDEDVRSLVARALARGRQLEKEGK